MLVDEKASDFVLRFCPKIVAARRGCIAKKKGMGTTFSHQKQRKTDSPTRISSLDLPVSLPCYGPIHEITCHLFIYVAPGAARRNLNEKSKSSINVTSAKRCGNGNAVHTLLHPAGSSDANQQSSLGAYS